MPSVFENMGIRIKLVIAFLIVAAFSALLGGGQHCQYPEDEKG